MQKILVTKGRTNVVELSVGYDVSTQNLVSEIRERQDPTSPLIAAWDISFKTDGTDGEVVMTLDDSATSTIQQDHGFMDVKRITAGEPFSLFEGPLYVVFQPSVTA